MDLPYRPAPQQACFLKVGDAREARDKCIGLVSESLKVRTVIYSCLDLVIVFVASSRLFRTLVRAGHRSPIRALQ